MTSVNITTQSNTVTVQQGDATTVTIATQGPQGPSGSGLSDVVDDTSPQLGGDLASNGFDIKFADNDKALFGADSDLQIFHDSSHSVLKDNGTGQLKILTSTLSIKNVADNSNSAIFSPGSSSSFFHSGSKKLQTTSSGITVTGSVTTEDINMSNLDGTANEVDNTKGSWSIQEGADDLFLINRVSGKKYKFNLTEVS
tara:strand:- start:42 stop:635 length:594 start_codon:yes stop_codon:yes gene_type:complete